MALCAPSSSISHTSLNRGRSEARQSSSKHCIKSDLLHPCKLKSSWKTGSCPPSCPTPKMELMRTHARKSAASAVQVPGGGKSARPKTATAAAVQERGYTQPVNASFLGSILSPFRRVVLPKADEVDEEEATALEPSTMAGKLIDNGMVYRENFVIRCYEVGVNRTASIESIANLLQEIGCNHAQSVGFSNDGFATTPLMREKRLIWVTTRMHIEMEMYPKWGDVVEIDTWFQGEGNIVSRRDWVIRMAKTGTVIGRGTSTWVTINQDTRRLSKIPDDVRAEFMQHCPEPPRFALPGNKAAKILKLEEAQNSCAHLRARRGDLDMNKHVNNVTYIGWMLESVPVSVLETAELAKITLEYRQEVSGAEVVESLCMPENLEEEGTGVTQAGSKETNGAVVSVGAGSLREENTEQYTHLLRLQDTGKEINRGRTVWRMRSYDNVVQ